MGQINLLTLNINGGFDVSRRRFLLPALREGLHGIDADIVLLQEVLGAHAGHARRYAAWPQQPQHAYLAESKWAHQVYGPNARLVEGDQGNAILSRLPVAHSRNRDVSIAGHEPRGLLHAVLKLPGSDPLHVINVHLGLLEAHRREQIQALCRIAEHDVPVEDALVVAGDFNDWRRRGHDALRAAGLREAFEEHEGRPARTFPSMLPALQLDRIYLRNVDVHWLERLSSSPWSRLSDHIPLFARLEIRTRQ